MRLKTMCMALSVLATLSCQTERKQTSGELTDSQVYVYHRQSGEVSSFALNSLFVENEISASDIPSDNLRAKFEFQSVASRFMEVHYSPRLQKYFRPHVGKKEKLFDQTRPMYLMVYDERTDEGKEYILPASLSEQHLVHDDVMYIAYLVGDTDETFSYARIDLAGL